MKLGRITRPTPDGDQTRLVAVLPEEDRVVDLARAHALAGQRRGATPAAAARIAAALFPSSMAAAIGAGAVFLDEAAAAVGDAASDDASLPIADVSWTAAVDPPMIRDSLTFPLHMQQFHAAIGGGKPNRQHFSTPGFFKGSTGVVYGHDQEIPYPGYTEQLDYELEMGYVVGAPGRNLTPEEGRLALFGLTIFNDFSARDVQGREMDMGMGPQKCKDFAYGIGPWITTIDELPPIESLTGSVRVNGEEWSTCVAAGAVWNAAELLAYVSISDHLQPGDVIGSGTLGNGSGLEIGRYLAPGDVLELELSGVGVLRHRIGTEPEKAPWWPDERPYPFD